jgi:hypothetical protein
MLEAVEFRQYAEEAMGWAREATTEQEKRTLIELARTWSQAAAESERAFCEAAPTSTRIAAGALRLV